MFKKLISTAVFTAIAGFVYYAYKNRDKIEENLEDDKVIHYIDVEDKIEELPKEEKPEKKTKASKSPNKKSKD